MAIVTVIPGIVIPSIETVAKMPKYKLRINLIMCYDLGIINPRFILHF